MDRKKATCVCIRIYIHKTEVESYTKKSNDESYFEKWIKVFKHKERIERQKNAKIERWNDRQIERYAGFIKSRYLQIIQVVRDHFSIEKPMVLGGPSF